MTWHLLDGPRSSALAFSACSLAMLLFNKSVMTAYDFQAPYTLLLLQAASTLLLLHLWRLFSCWLPIYAAAPTLPALSLETAARMLPLSALFLAKLVTGMLALDRTSVPLFTALRQGGVVIVLAAEYAWLGAPLPSRAVCSAIAAICAGAALAALVDGSASPGGLAYVAAANVAAALYAVFINATRARTGLDVVGLLYYNTLLTLPALTVACATTRDLADALAFPDLHRPDFIAVFSGSVALSFALNLSLFYCATLNGAAFKTVVSGVKSAAAFLLGGALFADYVYHPLSAAGLAISLAGGVAYTWLSLTHTRSGARSAGALSVDAAAEPLPPDAAVGGASTAVEISGGGGGGGVEKYVVAAASVAQPARSR